jgi:hypothetical protein
LFALLGYFWIITKLKVIEGKMMKSWNSDFDKRFNRMQRFVTWFIGGVLVLILCIWVGGAVLAYTAVTVAGEQDWSGGIKPVIERLWCGKPGCFGD